MARIARAAAVLLIATMVGCGPSAEQQVRKNHALYIAPGAADLFYNTRYGLQVSYQLREQYPAQGFLRNLRSRLAKQGWKPLRDDFLNPGLPSSNARGWQNFIDGTQKPEEEVRQWIGDWERNGDIVRYGLLYRWPQLSQKQLGTVIVVASYYSRDVVNKMRKSVRHT